METLSIKKSYLKELIRESVREAIVEERAHFYELLIPLVSKKELKNIEALYKDPSNYQKKNFKDLTNWVMK